MQLTTFKVNERSKANSRATKRLRKQGVIPAVYYGNSKDTISLSLKATDLHSVLAPGKRYTLLDLEIDGKGGNPAVITDYQKDAVSQEITHVDFLRIEKDVKIDVKIPVRLNGNPVGVRNEGGMLRKEAKFLKLRALPENIPAAIKLDITNFKADQVFYARDIDLGDAELLSKPQTVILTITKGRTAAEIAAEEAEIMEEADTVAESAEAAEDAVEESSEE
ncbi:MAG: 50S ribosomal protein L25 [Fibrobacter sp.]|nr:50S ribosomal protein L25 [Fibrobacter sp.]